MAELVLSAAYKASPALDDRVEAAMFLFRSTGSSIGGEGSKTEVRLYFETRQDRAEAEAYLRRIPGVTVTVFEEESVNWLDRYEQSLEPLEIGRRWIVAARPDVADDFEREILIIPQERAFGTGSHATTALCLELLEELAVEDRSCLDVGAGSGILSIAAARMGAEPVIAFDIDPDAIGPLQRNPSVNGVRLSTFVGELEAVRSGVRFDLILMNILPHVIIPSLPRVADLLSSDGVLIVSGVIEEEVGRVVTALDDSDLEKITEARSGEWWAAVVRRRKRSPVD